jgi:gluconolactonase
VAETSELTRLAGGYGLLEGARWYREHGLVFSDMTNGGVYRLPYVPAALSASGAPELGPPETVIAHRKAIGGLVAHARGGLVVSGRNVSVKDGEQTSVLLEAAPDEQFFNDLTADGRGRVFAGSMPKSGGPKGSDGTGRLYLIDLDRTVTVLTEDVLIANGLAADPDDALLYQVDSGRHLLWRFALSGAPADIAASREQFVSTAEYRAPDAAAYADGVLPDGLAMAADGSVWVALAGAGLVVGYDPSGRRIAEIAVPHALATSVCLGGSGLSTLFILTGTNDDYPTPEGGSIFATPAPRSGLPAPKARVDLLVSGLGHAGGVAEEGGDVLGQGASVRGVHIAGQEARVGALHDRGQLVERQHHIEGQVNR